MPRTLRACTSCDPHAWKARTISFHFASAVRPTAACDDNMSRGWMRRSLREVMTLF